MTLERFLREEFRDSSHPPDRAKFHAIHFYLQELLIRISKGYTQHPDNYDRLIYATERLPRVVYISLNYDTIFDDRLRKLETGTLLHLDSYVDGNRRWQLIKPHGSVDWAQQLQQTPADLGNKAFWVQTPPDLDVVPDSYRVMPGADADALRLDYSKPDVAFYPALSAPLGSPDALTCPSGHLDFLRAEIAAQDKLDVLMLGYSGLDDEVLKLFAGKPVGHLQAVAGNQDQAQAAMIKLVTAINGHDYGGTPVAFDGTFSSFAQGTGLDDYLARRNR